MVREKGFMQMLLSLGLASLLISSTFMGSDESSRSLKELTPDDKQEQVPNNEYDNLWDPISKKEKEFEQMNAYKPVDPLIMDRNTFARFAKADLSTVESKESKHIADVPKEIELDTSIKASRIIFFVTPTYKRPTQMVDLVRLSQVLQLARLKYGIHIFWIVIEDSPFCTHRVRSILEKSNLPFTHIHEKSPPRKINPQDHKGVSQRNAALDLIDAMNVEGVVYLGDDDNAYDVNLFAELARVKRFGVLPAAMTGGGWYERCTVDPKNTNRVVGLLSNFNMGRKYKIDMGSIAFTTTLLRKKKARFHFGWKHGHLESEFTNSLISGLDEIEPLASNCNAVYVWHVKTKYETIPQHRLYHVNEENAEQFKKMTALI